MRLTRCLLLLVIQQCAAFAAPSTGPFKVVVKNKQAYRNYEIVETFEAGIELLGIHHFSIIRAHQIAFCECVSNIRNRKVYEFLTIIAGTEVKSARGGKVSIEEGYVAAKNGQCVLHGVHISPHETTNSYYQHESKRPRRLLLSKKEIKRLQDMTGQSGFTVVPLTLYFNHKNMLKISIGLAKVSMADESVMIVLSIV
jgi:SsrA-binding protein